MNIYLCVMRISSSENDGGRFLDGLDGLDGLDELDGWDGLRGELNGDNWRCGSGFWDKSYRSML